VKVAGLIAAAALCAGCHFTVDAVDAPSDPSTQQMSPQPSPSPSPPAPPRDMATPDDLTPDPNGGGPGGDPTDARSYQPCDEHNPCPDGYVCVKLFKYSGCVKL
jgi:hypothetical protein